jgi:multidrug resistance efflux pump
VADPKARITVYKDCFVVDVPIADSSAVRIGEIIAVLDTEDEDRTLDRIALAGSFIDLQQESISDAQITIRRDILKSTADVANAYLNYANVKLDDVSARFRGGTEIYPDVQQATAAVARASAEVKRANAALSLFEFNVKQATAKLALIQAEIPKETAAVNARKGRVSVQSPVAGVIQLLCYKGAFVKKGDVLANVF